MQNNISNFKIDQEVQIEFFKRLNTLDELDYLISLINMSIAPTLYEKKVGTLLTIRKNKKRSLETWNIYKNYISSKLSCDYIELKSCDDHVVVLFYKKESIENILSNKSIRYFLHSIGYINSSSYTDYLLHLKNRFLATIPDEVGIFLGYHFEDVLDFYFNHKKKCLVCGYWKCFNNKNLALSDFKRYNLAKEDYMRRFVYS